jgi:ATP-dependent RNA helicase MSS116
MLIVVFPALRHASSQAATEEAVDQDTTSHQSSSQAKPLSMTTTPQGSVAVGSEFPTFVSLEGRVSQETLKAITGKPLGNLKHMSAVQAQVLPRLPELARPYEKDATGPQPPRDLLVKAKTGTGKTLGFLVPAVEARVKAIAEARRQALATAGVEQDKQLELRAERMFTRTEVGTLIISPTRELATQIANEAIKLTHFHEGFEVRLLVGGMSKGQQIRDWMKGRRDIVVATPGRLRDMIDSVPEVAQALLKTRQVVLFFFSVFERSLNYNYLARAR